MNRLWISMALGAILTGSAFAGPKFVTNELLVKVSAGSANLMSLYNASTGAVVISEMPGIGVVRLRLPSGLGVTSAKKFYEQQSGVEYAEPNYIAYATLVPSDPMYSQQYSSKIMKGELAWDLTTGSNTVTVAVIDTGVDYTHPDLLGRIIKGHDYVNGDEDPMDDHGHGTHCSGIVGANANNGIGVAGMNWNCKILGIKVLGAGGSGTFADIDAAMMEAADKGADVISMSLGGGGVSQSTQAAVNYAWNKGSVLLAACGNNGVDQKFYPAACDNVISVGATDSADKKADFSNFGDWVDIAAPGVGILSTLPNNTYAKEDGTSMACPNAAGVASLMISYAGKGAITNADVRDIICDTTDNVGSWLIHGRVNAFAAVSKAVPPIFTTVGPTTATMFDGTTWNGSASSLWTIDGVGFSVYSRTVANLGGVAGTDLSFDYGFPTTRFQSGTLAVRAKAKKNSTTTVYFKKNDGTYTLMKSFATTGGFTNMSVPIPSPVANYLSSANKFSVVVRSVVPTRFGKSSYALNMDSAILSTKTSSKATP